MVGSGSAGCAVAARLGRMGASVLLVEAGGEAQRSDRTQRAREAFRCWQSEHLGYCEGLLWSLLLFVVCCFSKNPPMYDIKERNKNRKLAKFGVPLETSLDDVGVFCCRHLPDLGLIFWGESCSCKNQGMDSMVIVHFHIQILLIEVQTKKPLKFQEFFFFPKKPPMLKPLRIDWGFRSTPQKDLLPEGRVIDLERGKTLGGSSAINYNLWVHGAAADFYRWENTIWLWGLVL